MDIQRVSYDDVAAAVRTVSARYNGNVVLHADAHPLGRSGFRGRIEVLDSRGPGSRMSWSGRHGKWACWHAYRDVMAEVFKVNPSATVKASLATYKGFDDFWVFYPGTAYKNVGSMVQPVTMPELCSCPDSIRGNDA